MITDGLPFVVWKNIQQEIEKRISARVNPQFVQGKVIRADPLKNLVWIQDLGAQPIPFFAFDYQVKYYDTQTTGKLEAKFAVVTPLCPKVGDIVLVARQHGSRRLPKCIGVLRSTDFVVPEGSS